MATIKDVADKANVSITTVSRVLNNDKTMMLSQTKRKAIFEAAQELNYVPRSKRNVEGEKIVIGLADWQIIEESQVNTKLSSLQYLASEISNRYSVEFVRFQYQEEVEFHGVLALGTFNEDEIAYLNQVSFNIVFVNSEVGNYNYNRINVDIKDGFKRVIERLQEEGKTKIGYIGGLSMPRENIVIGRKRIQVLKETLQEFSLYNSAYFKIGEFSEAGGYKSCKAILKEKEHADYYVVGNDACAIGVLKALKEEKKQQFKIILYNDIETVNLNLDKLIVMKIYHDAMWKEAITILLNLIFNNNEINKLIHLPILIKWCD